MTQLRISHIFSHSANRSASAHDAHHLISTPSSTYPHGVFAADLTKVLQERDCVSVFRSIITAPEDTSFRFHGVCKIAYGDREVRALEREAGFYQHQLRHLQGKYIPCFFGIFVGTSSRGPTAALVTSYEGRELQKPMSYLCLQFRKRVYRALRRIHQAGVEHGDFDEHNVVVRQRKDGSYSPIIVDFNRALAHECVIDGKKTQIYGFRPEPEYDVCMELNVAGTSDALDIWKPQFVTFRDKTIPAEVAVDVETLLEYAKDIEFPQQLTPDQNRQVAEVTVARLHRWYDERMQWDRSPEPVE